MRDSLAPAAVRSRLRGRFGTPLFYKDECESTQLMLQDPLLPEGAVAVAEHQTAGRGRLGRRWEAPAGTAVHCSLLLRPPKEVPAPQLSLVAGLAVAEAVEDAAHVEARVKWPNDVLVEAEKVAGILAEMHGPAVVLGIGINVNQTEEQLPTETRAPASSLRSLTGNEYDRAGLLAAVLYKLELHYDVWRERGLAALHGELVRRDFLAGREVAVDGIEGVAEGIDAEGRLVVAGHPVASGEVTYY